MNATSIKLYRILSTFTSNDWKNFGCFIKSPYFVSGRDYSTLYKILYKRYKSAKTIDEITFEKILTHDFRKENMTERTIGNRLSEFTLLAEKFIKQKYFSEDMLEGKYYLLKHYSDNLFHKEFDSIYDLDIDLLKPAEISVRDFERKMNIFELKLIKDIEINDFNSANSGLHKFLLFKLANSLCELFYIRIEYYFLEDKKVSFELFPVKKIFRNINLEDFIKIIENFKSPVFTKALIYYYLYEILINDKGNEFFNKLETLLFDKGIKYEEKLRQDILLRIEDYYVIKINNNETKYVKPLFKLYKQNLINGKIAEDIMLHRDQIFDNYVAIGLRAGEYDDVKKYIHLNIDSFPKNIREEVYILAMVRLYSVKNEFRNALNVIESRKRKNIQNGVIIRMELRLKYELEMTEEALLEVDRIKHYLRNTKKISGAEGKRTLLFISYYLKLIKVKNDPEHKGLEDLIIGINKSKVLIPALDWLREKIKEL